GATRVVNQAGNRARPEKPPGNLELVIEVAAHPFFRRVGDDVVCKVPITFAQAALGGEIDVPSLEGKLKVRVPPSTQSGAILRVRGKGFPYRIRGGRGDQLVEVGVEVPSRLTEKARSLIEELGRELGEDVQPQQKSFLEKLRTLIE
ncbi:MAG TPA: DnaJ C-terminal domain-containing protein, partial [Polyangiaceae bacterium]